MFFIFERFENGVTPDDSGLLCVLCFGSIPEQST